jgi:hypothetical protein
MVTVADEPLWKAVVKFPVPGEPAVNVMVDVNPFWLLPPVTVKL